MLAGDEKPLAGVVETIVEIVSTEMIGSLEDVKPSSAMGRSIEIIDTETMKFSVRIESVLGTHKTHNTQTHTKHEACYRSTLQQ